jgi:hypothetical protein
MPELDPDAENADATEKSKSFGQHMKDAAHDLKEDVKDAARRDKGDEDAEKRDDDEGGAGER